MEEPGSEVKSEENQLVNSDVHIGMARLESNPLPLSRSVCAIAQTSFSRDAPNILIESSV